jgi:Lon protease-like protein
MIKDCLKQQQEFGVVLIKAGLENAGSPDIEKIGTLAKIVSFDQGPDGLLHITVQGTEPFQVNSHSLESNGLTLGRTQPHLTQNEKILDSHSKPVSLLKKILMNNREPDTFTPPILGEASWVAYRLAEFLEPTNQEKLAILAESNAQLKLDKVEKIIKSRNSDY